MHGCLGGGVSVGVVVMEMGNIKQYQIKIINGFSDTLDLVSRCMVCLLVLFQEISFVQVGAILVPTGHYVPDE